MTEETVRTGDEARIRRLLDERIRALHAKDVAAYLSHYADGVVLFDLAPPLQQANAAGGKELAEWFSTFDGPVGFDYRELRVTAGGDLAYSHGFARITGRRTDGEDTDVWVRETLCLRRTPAGWKVAHEHQSVPFYMDGSLRAAVDLQP